MSLVGTTQVGEAYVPSPSTSTCEAHPATATFPGPNSWKLMNPVERYPFESVAVSVSVSGVVPSVTVEAEGLVMDTVVGSTYRFPAAAPHAVETALLFESPEYDAVQ